jgi:hypothetical protein
VIVCDFNFIGIAVLPAKAYTILLVDPNAVLASAIPSQSFKSVPGRDRKLGDITNTVELVKLAADNRP